MKHAQFFVESSDLAEATHGPLMHAADLGAEPIQELEFDQTLGW